MLEYGRPLIQYEWCFKRRGNLETDKYTGRIVYEDEGGDWVDTSNKPKKVKDCQQTTRDQVRGMEQIIQKVKRKKNQIS